MNNIISDLPEDTQLTSIIALQVDGYGINQTCNILKYIPSAHVFSKACSIVLSLGVSEWIRSMKPHGEPPDLTTLSFKMYDGTEICLERHAMMEDGGLKSIRSIIQQEMLEKARKLYELGEFGKLFIVEPEGE